jgi:hypothetical protein
MNRENPERKRRPRRRTPEKLEAEMRDTLRQATPAAARLLVESLFNESLSGSLRVDCAKEILNRVYGKQILTEEGQEVSFVMEEALQNYAE